MPNITSANLASAIVKLVAAEALPALVANLVMGQLVNRNYEPALQSAGDTINVPIPPALAANNIAETGTVTTQAVDAGNAQIVLDTHSEASFVLPDVTRAIAVPDLIKLYMQPAINAVAEAIEFKLLGLYTGFTTNAAVGTGGTAITESVVEAAETALFKAKVPANQPKFMVVSPETYSTMRVISRFSEMQTAGQAGADVIINGQIGRIKDFMVFRSQLTPKTGSSPVTTQNIAFARDAMALVIRRLPTALNGTGAVMQYVEQGGFGLRVVMSYNPNSLAQQFTIDTLFGAGILRNAFGVTVRS